MATGIPPHIEAMSKIESLTSLIREEQNDRARYYEEVKLAIIDRIEEVSEANGQITRPAVIKMFNEFGSKFETAVISKIDYVLLPCQNSNRGRLGDEVGNEGDRKVS